MADSKTNRAETSNEGRQALANRDRGQAGLQGRNAAGGWLSSPFDFFDRMAEEMDRRFDRMLHDAGMPRRSWFGRSPSRFGQREGLWSPRIEAFQKEDRFVVRADLPGLKKDDVQVDVTDDAITIHGERREEHEEQRDGYYQSERQYGQFSRTIPLPEGVITDSAQASFKNGVLEVTMQAPPAEATRGRRVEIKEDGASDQKQ
jgi:HSP20 family protein